MKVNDYIKTKTGFLGQIVNINDYREPNTKYGINVNYIDMPDILFIGDEDIIKSSPNIIDLIEEDDIVNNQMVWHIKEDNDGKYLVMCFDGLVIREKDIETIVTKEQFERCEYKI